MFLTGRHQCPDCRKDADVSNEIRLCRCPGEDPTSVNTQPQWLLPVDAVRLTVDASGFHWMPWMPEAAANDCQKTTVSEMTVKGYQTKSEGADLNIIQLRKGDCGIPGEVEAWNSWFRRAKKHYQPYLAHPT